MEPTIVELISFFGFFFGAIIFFLVNISRN